jgi:hypothetical protein
MRRLQGGSRYMRPASHRHSQALETQREEGAFIPNRAMRRGRWGTTSTPRVQR